MKTVIVSLLSDHLIPNYLFIKEMAGEYDDLVFITTDYVAQKHIGKFLENAIGLAPGSVSRVLISNEDFVSTYKTLEEKNFSKDCKYIVNITGGTKIMSLAVFEFFKKIEGSEFVYVPINQNTYRNVETGEEKPLSYRVNLEEYFALYGLRFEKSTYFLQPSTVTMEFFEQLKKNKFRNPPEIKYAHLNENPTLKKYYSGAWFEEYCYIRIKKQLGLSDKHIALSLKIYREDSIVNDNEIDVAFVFKNKLYIIECKYSVWGESKKPQKSLEDYLYKLAAICKDFGLKVNSYIFTLHPLGRLSPITMGNINKRMRILGVKNIIGQKELKEPTIKFD